MENNKPLYENFKRIRVLNDRLDKLIYLNQRFRYTTMLTGKIPNPREAQYTRLLLAIHKEKTGLWLFNRENNKDYSAHLENAKKAVVTLTREMMFNLNQPKL